MTRPDRGLVVPALVPALAGSAVLLAAASWLLVAHLAGPPQQRLVDLAVYRDAGRSVLDHRPVYDHLTAAPQRLAFTYPPFAALASVPLAWLPFGLVGWLWTATELAALPVITWWGFRRLLPRAGRWWPSALGVLSGVLVQLLPFRDELKFGQVDELVVLACLLDCVVARPRWPRGLLVGVAVAVKLTPGVFIPYLWLTGRRRAAGVAVATFVALGLLTAAVLPGASSAYWTDDLFHTGRLQPNDGTSNQSLRGMLLRAHLPHLALDGCLGAALLVVAVVGFRRARDAAAAGDEVTGVALTGLLAVLLSPVAWIHHLVWLPLVVGVLVGDGRSRRRVAAAVVTVAWFVVKVPWIGRHMLHTVWPQPLARVVEDGYGLAAVALLLLLSAQRSDAILTRTSLEERGQSRHHGRRRERAHALDRVEVVPGPRPAEGP